MDIASLLGDNVASVIEQYVISDNPQAYLQSLPDTREKKIVLAIRKPFSKQLKKDLIEAGVPHNLAEEIYTNKKNKFIQEAKTYEQAQEILEEMNMIERGHSNYFRPVDSKKTETKNTFQETLPSKFNPKYSSQNLTEYFLEGAKNFNIQKRINYLDDFGLRQLPSEFLLNLPIDLKQQFLERQNIFYTFDTQFVADFLNVFIGEKKRTTLSYELSPHYYSNLTVDQINAIGKKIPDLFSNHRFVQKWFLSNYANKYQVLTKSNQNLNFAEKEEKRRLLQNIPDDLDQKEIKNYFPVKGLVKQLFIELLLVDLSIKDPDLTRFIKYLETLKVPLNVLRDPIKQKIYVNRQTEPIIPTNICLGLESTNYDPLTFITNYIKALIRKYIGEGVSTIDSQILKYIDETQYFRAKAEVYLSEGHPLEILSTALPQSELSVLKQKKMLTIQQNNRKSFEVNEEVSLQLRTKRISAITIKIYELNLQKHYLENQAEVDEQVNLHYLQPTYSTNYEIQNTDPFKESLYDIAIPQVKKQRGVYVIDFDGEGLSSRAIIRKGSIYCLRKLTLAGVELRFYDEGGKKIQELDIWLRGQKVHISKSYIIPFGERPDSFHIIAVVGSYAELINISIPQEQYNLQMRYFFNPESFIVGTKAKIILHPRLELIAHREGPQKMSLKLLKNIRIKIQMEDMENVKSALSLENVTWSTQEDYVIEVPIQTHIQSLKIEGSADIKMYNGKKQELKFIKIIAINQSQEANNFCQAYLKKQGENYIVHTLGFNGEKVPNVRIQFIGVYKWVSESQARILESNENGEIHLGKLTNFTGIIVKGTSNSPMGQKAWKLQNFETTANILQNSNFRYGQKIVVPLPSVRYEFKIGTDINLAYQPRSAILKLCNENVNINGRYLEIVGLPEGNYLLSILSINVRVSINVLKGVDWEEPYQMYIPKKSTVYQFVRTPNHYLMLGKAQIQQKNNGFKQVTVQVIHPQTVPIPPSAKAHIFATNFIPQGQSVHTYNFTTISFKDVRVRRFAQKNNTYFSNKKLSEQAAYVLNRKNQKQFIGNNLEKPKIFLNRIKVRGTEQKEEKMQKEAAYKDKFASRNNDLLDFDDFSGRGGQAWGGGISNDRLDAPFSSHNNFLAESGLTVENIKDSKISFILPPHYNHFVIVLVSNTSQITQNYNCSEASVIKAKNVRHLGIRREDNAEEAWSMSREVYPVQKGQTVKVNRNSKWCTVSLMNIINFAKTKGIILEDWVSRWSTYTEETKLKTYSKKVCHELNSYIKHHDPGFFAKIVLPYISNKVNKTFVDLCLLEDKQCMDWAPVQYFQQLNDFQKILLIEFMVKIGESERAARAAKAMELRQKIKKQSFFVFKREFDTMLNAKIGENFPKISPPPPPPPQIHPQMQPYLQSQNQNYSQGGFGFGASSSGGGGALFSASSQPTNYGYGGYGSPPPPPSAALFGMPSSPPPPGAMMFGAQQQQHISRTSTSVNMMDAMDSFSFSNNEEFANNELELMQQRNTYQQTFKEVQKTEEFTEVTYQDIPRQNQQQNKSLIPQQKFWADLAAYLIKGTLDFENFITDSILYLTSQREFTLASSFIPKALNADFQMHNDGESFQLKAKTSFLIFSKEIKCLPRKNKFGVMVNHRLFDPKDQYTYEDGARTQKQLKQFIYLTPYTLQTVVTNISGTELDVQLLIDIPQGAIPLNTKEYTQITNTSISAFSTRSFRRDFYFPQTGEFQFYTTSVSWNNIVIGKGQDIPSIKVGKQKTINELKSFNDVIEAGNEADILDFIQKKNIFDSNIFNSSQILWMLEEKTRFEAVTQILRDRGLMDANIWKFSFLHKDLQAIKQYLVLVKKITPLNSQPLKVFEYFPYYSSRAHKYTNENKSKIRNVQFKQTYYNFLFDLLCYSKDKTSGFQLALCYYLLLQDRVDQASLIFKQLQENDRKKHQIQFDYLECFLDMYEGYPSFSQARKICQKYASYPILRWKDMFSEIQATLKEYDSAVYVESSEKNKVAYETAVFNEGEEIRVSIPAKTKVEVNIFSLNLELMFSENPFEEVESFSAIKPSKQITLEAGEAREEKVKRDQDLKDAIVHVYETMQGLPSRKVTSFMWSNPDLKVKVNENRGNVQVFYRSKCVTGCYCKVYARSNKGDNFYRDGYTDIAGTFKYALADLQDITLFSIISVTNHGSVITKVRPPSQAGLLAMI